MAYTAEDVKRLREATAAGMVDCKKALDEAGGDFDKAVEIIRVKGLKGVTKREGRSTSNGLIAAKADGGTAVMLELNCETDFVSKNDDFLKFTSDIAKLVTEHSPADVAALSALGLYGKTVEDVRTELIGRIGENSSRKRYAGFAACCSLARIAATPHSDARAPCWIT